MSQKNIKNYFLKKPTNSDQNISSSSSDSDSESDEIVNINKYISSSADVSYYKDLFKRKEELKQVARIICESGVSECWKYFGHLYISTRKLKKNPLIIPEMEKEIIKEFAIFLEIFEKATKYLQGQMYPTISVCIYFYENIMSSLEKTEKESCFDLTIRLCNFSINNFRNRFLFLKIHVVAALLDPCQKNWSILEKYLKKIPKHANTPNSFVLKDDVDNHISREKLLLDEIKKVQFDNESPSTSSAAIETAKKKQVTFFYIVENFIFNNKF